MYKLRLYCMVAIFQRLVAICACKWQGRSKTFPRIILFIRFSKISHHWKFTTGSDTYPGHSLIIFVKGYFLFISISLFYCRFSLFTYSCFLPLACWFLFYLLFWIFLTCSFKLERL